MEVIYSFFDILFINNASLSDSTLISKTLFFIARSSIRYLFFQHQKKTIFLGLILALNAFNNSPSDTTSAPDPNFLNSVKIETFEFDLTETD